MRNPISPKVTAVLVVGLLASIILPSIGLVTPDMLSRLGSWGPFWYGVAVTALSTAAGWLKNDPLRASQLPGKHEAVES